jgi:hypothetical protein
VRAIRVGDKEWPPLIIPVLWEIEMSVTANRSIAINTTVDSIINNIYAAAENPTSPGSVTIHELANGANTITVPLATGVTVKAATIIPPSANSVALTLKGVAGDTGVILSSTDPTSIAFQTAPVSFVLTAGGTISGLRIVWT